MTLGIGDERPITQTLNRTATLVLAGNPLAEAFICLGLDGYPLPVATMLFKYDKDTTDVSGAACVAVAVLAGLAFTYAGVLSDTGRDRDDVIYAGERLCQGATLFLVALLLKYGTIVVPVQVAALPIVANATSGVTSKVKVLVIVLQIFLFLIFMNGLLASQLGYTILGRVVMRRMSRRGKQDVYFPPSQVKEQNT